MNHLLRDLAPVSEAAWAEIDSDATRHLTHFLAARKLVDFVGPCGWDRSAVSLGRASTLPDSPLAGIVAAQRQVLPLLELGRQLTLVRSELEAVDRGAADADLDPLADACRELALAEDSLVFNGFEGAGITGIAAASPHVPIALSEQFDRYPNHVAKAVAVLKEAGVGGPYAIALGPRCYTGVIETTERGGYPILQAPAPDPRRPGNLGAGGRRGHRAQPARRRLLSSPSARTSRSPTAATTPTRSPSSCRRAWPSRPRPPRPPSPSATRIDFLAADSSTW
ncbi:family 1 encapsulin nanocompartment shell protein [Iamia sp.]|uniref:family 1 encapsulin nanocompartment shell protein n=1 Tax=Iamia sp. TaxID=2722710 RepID=UPI002C6B88E3|nr:family 1 encapsulin nanocompartment shell protein [Iamia sp.]HXH59142.1 family 1 encapsulin nanocompartment shell protein [Iamia sp.]